MFTPLTIKPLALRRDAMTVVAASILFLVLVGGSALQRIDAFIFLSALVAYLLSVYFTKRSSTTPPAELHKAEAEELSIVPSSLL